MFNLCSDAVSLLPSLEPIAGTALAINLAYLNLKRFRYRSEIRSNAEAAIKRLEQKKKNGSHLPKTLVENKWYQEVKRLSNLANNDGKNGDNPEKTREVLPKAYWAKLYFVFFEFHEDRVASYLFTFFALVGLLVGTSQNVGYLQALACWFSQDNIVWSLLALSLSVICPVVFVLVGAHVKKIACEYADENVEELEKLMQDKVPRARLKPTSMSRIAAHTYEQPD